MSVHDDDLQPRRVPPFHPRVSSRTLVGSFLLCMLLCTNVLSGWPMAIPKLVR